MHIITGMGMTKLSSQTETLWSGYGDSPETPNNKKLISTGKSSGNAAISVIFRHICCKIHTT